MSTIFMITLVVHLILTNGHNIHGESRMANGIPTSASQYPFIASIRAQITINGFSYTSSSFCGGSLLRKEYPAVILTAAHCVYNTTQMNETLTVNLYRTATNGRLSSTNNFTQTVVIGYLIHDGFDMTDLNNDIALLFLDGDFTNNNKLETVTIPNYVNTNTECCSTTDQLTVIGYGQDSMSGQVSETLEYTTVQYIDRTECNKQLTYFQTQQSKSIIDYVRSFGICGIGDRSDSSVCTGDSGSPLIKTGTNLQVGIVSWGFFCITQLPAVYTNLGLYKSWIDIGLQTYSGNQKHQFPYYPWMAKPTTSPTPSPTGVTTTSPTGMPTEMPATVGAFNDISTNVNELETKNSDKAFEIILILIVVFGIVLVIIVIFIIYRIKRRQKKTGKESEGASHKYTATPAHTCIIKDSDTDEETNVVLIETSYTFNDEI